MYLRLKQIDTDKDKGQQCTKGKYPFIPPTDISDHARHRLEGRIVLIDCITLWCTNFFFDLHSDTDRALAAVKAEFDRFTAQDATFIFVTNEIGMGGTSENELQRKFTDMQGWMNQYVAARADEVILMVSGIPLTVKNTHS